MVTKSRVRIIIVRFLCPPGRSWHSTAQRSTAQYGTKRIFLIMPVNSDRSGAYVVDYMPNSPAAYPDVDL